MGKGHKRRARWSARVFGAALLISAIGGGTAHAANFRVTNTDFDGPGSLRNALIYASDDINFPGKNTITISATGTLTLQQDLQVFGQVDIIGPGPGSFTVDGNGQRRAFEVQSLDASISGISIVNTDSKTTNGLGSAIRNHANLTLSNVVISGNNNSDFSAVGAGTIYNDGNLTINDSSFADNTTKAEGGAVYNDGTLTINNTTLSENHAGGIGGGGIFNETGATAVLNGSSLIGNDSPAAGGGIVNQGTLTATNTTLYGNVAGAYGGGIDTFSTGTAANTTLNSVTIVGNKASNLSAGDGAGLQNGEGPGAVSVTNSLIGLNIFGSGGGSSQCFGFPYASGGHNVGCALGGPGDSVASLAGTLTTPPAANGGPTPTIALLAGGPAVNNGAACPATDQRGYVRSSAPPCDAGAFELGATPPVPAGPGPAPGPGATPPKTCKKKKAKKRAAIAKKKKCKKKRRKK